MLLQRAFLPRYVVGLKVQPGFHLATALFVELRRGRSDVPAFSLRKSLLERTHPDISTTLNKLGALPAGCALIASMGLMNRAVVLLVCHFAFLVATVALSFRNDRLSFLVPVGGEGFPNSILRCGELVFLVAPDAPLITPTVFISSPRVALCLRRIRSRTTSFLLPSRAELAPRFAMGRLLRSRLLLRTWVALLGCVGDQSLNRFPNAAHAGCAVLEFRYRLEIVEEHDACEAVPGVGESGRRPPCGELGERLGS
jgi:hypothetical protein